MSNPNKIRVLHLAEWYPHEFDPQLGIFIHKHAVAVSNRTDSKLIYAYGVPGQKKTFEFKKEKEGDLEIMKVTYKKSSGILRYMNFFRYRIALQKAFLELNFVPQLVHVHVPGRNTFLARVLFKKYAIPYGVTDHWHGWIKGIYKTDKKRNKWIGKILKNASFFTVVSKILKDAVLDTFPQRFNEKIDIVPNVVEGMEVAEKLQNTILYVGDLDDEVKNISGLIDAFHQFSIEQADWEFHIVGGGKDEQKLKEKTSHLESKNIHFLGRLSNEEVLSLYSKYSFFVSSSKVETFGVAMAEALMSGIPVVAPEGTGADLFLTDNNSIRYINFDQDALKDALVEMAKNYNKFTIEALKNSVSPYTPEKIADQFIELYSSSIQ